MVVSESMIGVLEKRSRERIAAIMKGVPMVITDQMLAITLQSLRGMMQESKKKAKEVSYLRLV